MKPRWIVIGGGYAGALSAWFRTRYPDLSVGAWASSAMVRPSLIYSDYDYSIYTSTMKSGSDCTNSVREIG